MISWAVVAHTSRLPYATTLAGTLDAEIAIDDGSIGPGANHLRAWQLAKTTDTQWCAVVEDDAVPVPDITTQATASAAVAPEPIVSFYLGRTRPKRFQERISRTLARLGDRDPHWLTTSHMLHAVAVALHRDLVDDWMDWAHGSDRPIDERMTAWCIARQHRVAYAWPSLFDHADGPTLIEGRTNQPAGPRRAWRTGTRDTWTSEAVRM